MDKEITSPAGLFRDVGRVWAKNRSDRLAIANFHAATEAFRTLLEAEKALVLRTSLTIEYIDKELEQLERLDGSNYASDKLLFARSRSCERSVASCKQGRMFVAAWRDHFGHIVPEMAHHFPHTYELEEFFIHLEHFFSKKQDEFSSGHSFTPNPSVELGRDHVAKIVSAIQNILNHLHTVQHDLALLEHDRTNKLLGELVFEELQRLSPLVFVSKSN